MGAFIDVPFPVDLGYGSSGGPVFSTTIIETAGGGEQRNANWSQAKIRVDAATGVRHQDDLAELIRHFRAAAGRWAAFRFRDWSDYTTAYNGVGAPSPLDQAPHPIDGVRYQLSKTYVAGLLYHVRRITRPVAGTVRVAFGGVEQTSGWSIDYATGILTLAYPAGNVTVGFVFDVPCRYDSDTLSERLDDYLLGSASVPVVEVRE